MTIKEFAERIKEYIEENYKDKVDVRVVSMLKNNGITRTGVSIMARNCNISPTIYLESHFNQFLKGKCLDIIGDEIIAIYDEQKIDGNYNMDFFHDYEKVKDRVVYKLINSDKNNQLLNNVPHIHFLDMTVVFYYLINCDKCSNASIMINNDHMKMWGINLETIKDDAKVNTRKYLPEDVTTMGDLLKDMVNDMSEFEEASNMLVVSNINRNYGATSILYDNLLKDIAEEKECNLYVLPSSIHEVIVVDAVTSIDEDWLVTMVREVNRTQVPDEEILSDSVYYYDRYANTLELACESEAGCRFLEEALA